MTRVLVTGFNARTASPRRATRDTCFAALLAEALRDVGCTVDHRDTSVTESIDSYDHVFVGVASPLAVSSNRTYGALSTIGRAWSTARLTLFLDDPDIGKIPHGLKSLQRKPEQFTKDFFHTRVDYDVAATAPWRDWLLSVAHTLQSTDWPVLLVPAWPWANKARLLAALPRSMQANAVLVDLSSYMQPGPVPKADREHYWVSEESFKSPWVNSLGLCKPINHTRLNDTSRLAEYASSWGVLEDATKTQMHGWFRPKVVLAAHAGAVYVTRWQSMTAVGEMFTPLAHTVEDMSIDERDGLALQQKERLTAMCWDQNDVQLFVRKHIAPYIPAEEVS